MRRYRRLFLDVDTQRDFMEPQGRLYVPGAQETYPNIEALFDYARQQQVPIISTVDDHAPDDPEFADWPPHCVHGTEGQHKLPMTLLDSAVHIELDEDRADGGATLLDDHQQVIISKAEVEVFKSANLSRLVDHVEADTFVVFGMAFDVCVRHAAVGLCSRGRKVWIVRDAVKAVDVDREQELICELSDLGVEWVRASDIVQGQV